MVWEVDFHLGDEWDARSTVYAKVSIQEAKFVPYKRTGASTTTVHVGTGRAKIESYTR